MDKKTLNSLRIGDTVRIHFTHLGSSPEDARGQPFDVVIAEFHGNGTAHKGDDGHYYESRQISWRWADLPVELQPAEGVRDDIRGLDTCHEDWIIDIVARAPYEMRTTPRNVLYAYEQARFLDNQRIDAYRKAKGEDVNPWNQRKNNSATGYVFSAYNENYERNIGKGQFNGDLFKLAQSLLARRPQVAVTNHLDKDLFYAAWNNAGRPGRVGPYQETEFSPFMRNKDHERIDPSPFKALVNLKSFTAWVVRNVHRFVMSKKTEMKNMIQAAADEATYYEEEAFRDARREFGGSVDSSESSIENTATEIDRFDDDYSSGYDYVSEKEWEENRKALQNTFEPSGDTHFGMTLDQYKEKLVELGFEEVLKDDYTHSHCGRERRDSYYVYAHRDGFLVDFDTYTSDNREEGFGEPSLNHGSLHYNWQPTSLQGRIGHVTSSGGFVRYPDDVANHENGTETAIYAGYHDIRQGLAHNMKQLKDNGTILNTWFSNGMHWVASHSSVAEQDRSVAPGQPYRDEWNRWTNDMMARSDKNFAALPEWVQKMIGEIKKHKSI